MRGSWKLGRFAGVDAYVHWTFALLLGWAALTSWNGAGSLLAVGLGIAFLLAVFGSVLLHELGHALMARRYGVRTRNILLTPIGGVASLEGMPASGRAELEVAVAGPAVNVALAAGLALVHALTGWSAFGLIEGLMWANVSLAVFNMIPAFPMDGGRALRALLATRMGPRAATRIAVGLGKVVAVAMAIAGLVWNPMLIMIAAFVWFAGSAEARTSELHDGYAVYDDGRRVTAPWWAWQQPTARPAAARVFWDGRRFILLR